MGAIPINTHRVRQLPVTSAASRGSSSGITTTWGTGMPPVQVFSPARSNKYSVNGNLTGQPSTVSNYDADGNPIYAVPPAGQVIVGHDSVGTPIYGPATNSNQLVPGTGMTSAEYSAYLAQQQAAAAAGASGSAGNTSSPTTTVDTGTDPYSSIVDWFNSETLISGIPNFWIVGGGAFLWLLISKKRQGRG